MLKILFLCKRMPQGRDLLRAPYGRFFHLPRLLAERGHAVTVALLSHTGLPAENRDQGGVHWTSDDATQGFAYLKRIGALAGEGRPDWIIGLSDTYYGILAARYAARHGARCAIDAYDNFESYMPWALPLHALWRRALRRADLVTAAGPQLADHLGATARRAPTRILPMAADPAFGPLDRAACRRRLGLDLAARYVGVGGSLDARRGGKLLFEALAAVRARGLDVRLLLSGRSALRYQGVAGVQCVGMLPDEDMPVFVNSLNVACVLATENAFGRYSYPAKLIEAMACGIPVVASATGPMRWMLDEADACLAPVGDARALADRIAAQMDRGRVQYPPKGGWAERAALFDSWLRSPAPPGAAEDATKSPPAGKLR